MQKVRICVKKGQWMKEERVEEANIEKVELDSLREDTYYCRK